MQLRVLFFAGLRELAGMGELSFSSPADAPRLDVAELTTALAHRYPALAESLRSSGIRIAVNEDFVGPSHQLSDGDEVAFIPPVSGG